MRGRLPSRAGRPSFGRAFGTAIAPSAASRLVRKPAVTTWAYGSQRPGDA